VGTRTWAVGVIWGIVVAAPAFAQSTVPLVRGTGTAQQVVGQPIDMTKLVTPRASVNSPTSGLSRFFQIFNVSNIFSKRPVGPTQFSTSPFPPPGSFPSTKYPNALPPPALPIPGH
jgi:hypothetical protein